MTWPNWLKFGFRWTLPTFSKKNPPKIKPWSETDPHALDRVVDWKSRKEHLDKFDNKREQIIKELKEG